MKTVEWIFFDVGSTLMNEEKAYLHRLRDVADAVNESFDKIYNMAIALYKENKKGDLVSDGTLWEGQTAFYFRWTCLPDCALPELAADSPRVDRRLS